MMSDVSLLHSALVKIETKLIGSGVWFSMGINYQSYVLTAKHNLAGDSLTILDYKGNPLTIGSVEYLDEIDIAIISINEECKTKIEFCLDDQYFSENREQWILGYPKVLSENSAFKSIEHKGDILIREETIFFSISENLPQYSDKENIEGFSGAPIFEVCKDTIFLKGIITDRFDDNFDYKRVYGVKTSNIFSLLPEKIKKELVCADNINKIVDDSCLILNEKLNDYIDDIGFSEKIKAIDFKSLEQCSYFFLPDDRPKATQYVSILRNKKALSSYIYSRIISSLMDKDLSDLSINPTSFENNSVFTIHVSEFTKRDTLIAKLIRQEHSLDYSDSIILIVYSTINDELKHISKKRISGIISNFTEGSIPELYNRSLPHSERYPLKSFLSSRKENNVSFSIYNIDYLIEQIVLKISNELCDQEYQKQNVVNEAAGVIKYHG